MEKNVGVHDGGGGKMTFLDRVASVIIKGRFVIFAAFFAACIFCALSLGRVKINSELTAFLPEDTETRRGVAIMSEEFSPYASANVMVRGITYDEASAVAERISGIDKVALVSFDDTESYYKDSSALFSVFFNGAPDDPDVESALNEVKEAAGDREKYVTTTFGSDYNKQLAGEMGGVIAIAAIVILAVLLFTSRSYFEVVIFGIVFVIAALLNMGTNFLFGEISSITNSIAVILQLALAIDYAIIFAHRYQDEAIRYENNRTALIKSLSHSIVEISSSSLTTISGLIALTLMQFRLGYDLGTVLAKGIICSMLTVLLLMPGLISLFPRLLKKTAHRSFVPNVEGWGRHLAKRRFVYIVIFALILPLSVILSGKTEYSFSDSTVDPLIYSERREAIKKINETFEPNTAVAVLVPSGDFESEKALISDVSSMDGIKSVSGMAGIKFDGVHSVTDRLKLSELCRIFGMDPGGYSVFSELEMSVVDIVDSGLIGADDIPEEQRPLLKQLEFGKSQMIGKNYDRIILTSSLSSEGEKSVELVNSVKSAAEKYYDGDSVLVIGDITSARDLKESYRSDSVLISVLTVVFVFLILLATFRSPVTAAILVFVIQGSIWINFSIPYLLGLKGSFVTQMIVSAIQMGATIDYAIVMMSRYRALREKYEKRDAAALAVKESFPTVITSGAIMSAAGFLIAFRVSDVYVGHIGFAVGRGAAISVILVLTVLPQLLMLFDRAVEKTTLRQKKF